MHPAPQDFLIRPWRDSDSAAVPGLLDAVPDPYWLRQRQGVHGITARDDRFAVTLVAEGASRVVGVATLYENRFHPGRYPATVEVRPGRRRLGIGRALYEALLDHRPASRPLAVKVRDANHDARAFVRAMRMQPFQHCPGAALDPASPAAAAWVAAQTIPVGVRIGSLGAMEAADVVEALVEHYDWVHERWEPMGRRDVITDLWRTSVAEADPQLSSIATVDAAVTAFCLVWPDGREAEAVSETTFREQANGIALVSACLARSLREAGSAAVRRIELDGHDDDPHLATVVRAFPAARFDPVSLFGST